MLPAAAPAPRVRVGPAHVPRPAPRAHGDARRAHAAPRPAARPAVRPRRRARADHRCGVPSPDCAPRVMGLNVLGGELEPCGFDPLTGFYRDGCCDTGAEDAGVRRVCGDDRAVPRVLDRGGKRSPSTPRPEFGFAGLPATAGACARRAGRRRSRRASRRRCISPPRTPAPSSGARSRRLCTYAVDV